MSRLKLVKMTPFVRVAMDAVYSLRYDKDYQVNRVTQIFPGVAVVKVRWNDEQWLVAMSLKAAIRCGEYTIRQRLSENHDSFDGGWLLRFVRGDYHEHLERCPKEHQKHGLIQSNGFDMEAAVRDYRSGFRGVGGWLESVFDGHSFTYRVHNAVAFLRLA